MAMITNEISALWGERAPSEIEPSETAIINAHTPIAMSIHRDAHYYQQR